ncbi:MAG: tetratricopeptide repeat protein [Candidatus Eisenbacteria bacterium]|nr:tetratricopeptide repeat protein [Candidatus Eisenbacteria bacterium]
MKYPSRRTSLLLLLLLIGSALRFFHIFDMRESPVFDRPVMDPAYHHEWALSLVDGDPITDGEPYFRAPLYPYFLAALYRSGGDPLIRARAAQAIFGVFSLYLIYLLGLRVFSPAVAFLALGMALLYPLFPYFEGELLITSLVVFLDLLLLLQLLRAEKLDRRREWVVAGAVLGLSAIARPNVLLFAPAIPIWLAFLRRWGPRGIAGRTLLTAAGALLLILPITVRNARQGDPVLIASQGGINFYLGNHPGADGWSATAPGIRKDWWGGIEDARILAERSAGRPLRASEVSDYWYGRGLSFFRERPGEAFRLLFRKTYLLVRGGELSNNQIIPFAARYSRVFRLLPLGFGLIVPLALLGMLGGIREKRRLLLVLFLGFYSLSIVSFFICSRYRMPLLPPLLLFAAAALLRLGGDLRRRPARAGGAFLFLGGALFLLNHDFGVPGPVNWALGYQGEGLSLMERGDLDAAEERYRAAIRIDPGSSVAHHDLGVLLRRRGDLEGAVASIRLSLTLDSLNVEAWNNLGITLAAEGKASEAIDAYRRGIALDDRNPNLHANLAFLLQQEGRYEEAIDEYRFFLRSGIADGRIHANLGMALIRAGKTAEGEEELRRGVRVSPGLPGPVILLADHLAATGRAGEAIALLREAAARMPGDRTIERRLVALENGAAP